MKIFTTLLKKLSKRCDYNMLKILEKEDVFVSGKYFLQCHASTIEICNNGDLLTAWFAGTREKHPDVAIWMARRKNGVWLEPFKAADEFGVACWNPVLFRTKEGRIYLYYKVGTDVVSWYTMVTYSDDDAFTWSMPQRLFDNDTGGRGPVKNKPVYLSNGEIIAPASIETKTKWDAFTDISKNGLFWEKSSLVPFNRSRYVGKGIIQPCLWESSDGDVHMLLRSTQGKIFRSDSKDSGRSWCEAYETDIPNNNSGIDLIKIDNDTILLIYNPVGENWGIRTPLSWILLSGNGSIRKSYGVIEHNENPLDNQDGEFSYPAVIYDGKLIYISYTYKRRTIRFVKAIIF